MWSSRCDDVGDEREQNTAATNGGARGVAVGIGVRDGRREHWECERKRGNETRARAGEPGSDPVYTGAGCGAGVFGEGDGWRHGEPGGSARESGAAEFLGHVVRAVPHGSAGPGGAAEEISGSAAGDWFGGG